MTESSNIRQKIYIVAHLYSPFCRLSTLYPVDALELYAKLSWRSLTQLLGRIILASHPTPSNSGTLFISPAPPPPKEGGWVGEAGSTRESERAKPSTKGWDSHSSVRFRQCRPCEALHSPSARSVAWPYILRSFGVVGAMVKSVSGRVLRSYPAVPNFE